MRTVALAFSALMAAAFTAVAQKDAGRSVQGPAGGPVQAQDSSLSRGAQEFSAGAPGRTDGSATVLRAA